MKEKNSKLKSEDILSQRWEETKNGISWNDSKNKENFDPSKEDISSFEQMKNHINNEYSQDEYSNGTETKQNLFYRRNALIKYSNIIFYSYNN